MQENKRYRFDSWVRKIPWSKKWQPVPIFLPKKSNEQRSLVGYNSWGCKESDMTELLSKNTLPKRQPVLVFLFLHFLSIWEPQSSTPPGHYIHEESQEILTSAVGDNVFEVTGTHTRWFLSPMHKSSMPKQKDPRTGHVQEHWLKSSLIF